MGINQMLAQSQDRKTTRASQSLLLVADDLLIHRGLTSNHCIGSRVMTPTTVLFFNVFDLQQPHSTSKVAKLDKAMVV